jgi:hypothetical protein
MKRTYRFATIAWHVKQKEVWRSGDSIVNLDITGEEHTGSILRIQSVVTTKAQLKRRPDHRLSRLTALGEAKVLRGVTIIRSLAKRFVEFRDG